MSPYHDFFSTLGPICAGLWIVYPTIMLALSGLRSPRMPYEAFVAWVPVISGLQAGSFFAVGMLLCLVHLLPDAAQSAAWVKVNTMMWWFILAPIAVVIWRMIEANRAKTNGQQNQLSTRLFAGYNLVTTVVCAEVTVRDVGIAKFPDAATAVLSLVMIGVVIASLSAIVVYQQGRLLEKT